MFRVPPPTIVSIETNLACNCNCIMCPRTPVLKTRRNRVMPQDMVIKILDEIQEWKPKIQWGWINEPLADPKLFGAIAYARSLGLKGWINTNGGLLDDDNIPKLINSGLTQVNFSIDSMDPETYEKSRVGLKFRPTIEKIMKFINENNRCGHPVSTMASHIVIPGHNDNEMEYFRKFWSPIVDNIQQPLYRSRGADWDKEFISETPTARYCYFIENEMNITTDGDVPLCACDAICATPEANIKDGVYNAWNTPARAETIDRIRRLGLINLGFCREHGRRN